ncbi:MAG TPA: LysE family transporter [Hydrogenophaga sp.]|nr:LysE family transporter [Hydrogenophaga sp.]
MTGAEFSALLVLATATSFSPGPNTTLSTALAANLGLRRSLHFVCAVPVGWGLLLVLCAGGLGSLVVAWPALHWAILWGGVAYLLSLAWRLAGSKRLSEVDQSRLNVTFVQGVMLQFLNIKAWMLALAITAGWIAGRPDAAMRFALVFPLMLAFAFLSNLAYASAGSLLRHWLSGPIEGGVATGRRLQGFNRVMALALVLTAAWMLANGMGMPVNAAAGGAR